jgi:hypothetical protein
VRGLATNKFHESNGEVISSTAYNDLPSHRVIQPRKPPIAVYEPTRCHSESLAMPSELRFDDTVVVITHNSPYPRENEVGLSSMYDTWAPDFCVA